MSSLKRALANGMKQTLPCCSVILKTEPVADRLPFSSLQHYTKEAKAVSPWGGRDEALSKRRAKVSVQIAEELFSVA
jgi:hypothetical protein